MTPTSRRRGLTLFDGLLLVAIAGIVALVVVPARRVGRILEREDRAVANLHEIERRLRDHQRTAARDADRDGVGEFASLTEVLGPLADRARRIGTTDVWVLDGYRFQAFVPGGLKRPVPAGSPDAVTDWAEVAWLVVGWPADPGRTGMRAYAATPNGILQHQIDGYPYGDEPPFPDEQMVVVEGDRVRRRAGAASETWRPPVRSVRPK